MVKVIAIVLAAIIIILAGYMIVNSTILVINGQTVGSAIGESWQNITHLWGLIRDAKACDNEYPMANMNIEWNTNRSW